MISSRNDSPAPPAIALAGCGSMGLPMALQLRQAGFDVAGFDIRPLSEFGEHGSWMVASAGELSDRDVLISVVRDIRQTLDLCFDDQGIFTRSSYPRTMVISSTVSPRFIPRLQQRLPDDVTLIDAPMSGAPLAAKQGSLSFMVGGPEQAVGELAPLFEAMGDRVFLAGASGAGMTLKVLNNYVAATSVVSVRRVMVAAEQLGVAPERLREVMKSSSGATWFGNRFDAIDWASEGYASGNTIGILEKDVLSALDAMEGLESLESSVLDDAVIAALRELRCS